MLNVSGSTNFSFYRIDEVSIELFKKKKRKYIQYSEYGIYFTEKW
jgi:hypothetical protein